MIWLVSAYIIFTSSPFLFRKRIRWNKKEKILFLTITTIGFLNWVSIALNKPFSPDHMISIIIDQLLNREK